MSQVRIFAILFPLYAIYSLFANFSLYGNIIVRAVLFSVIAMFYLYLATNRHILRNLRESLLYLLAWGFVYGWLALYHGEWIGFGSLSFLLYGAFFLSMRTKLQKKIVTAFVWSLSVLLICSLVEYVIYAATRQAFVLGHVTRTTTLQSTYFSHLVFNLIYQGRDMMRFQSLADEPGRLGTLCGMLLFLVWRMKGTRMPLYVFLVSGLLSFSLAFYFLLLMFLFVSLRTRFRTMLVVMVMAGGVLFLIHDQFDSMIVRRFTENERLDNRTSAVVDSYFKGAISDRSIWAGVGKDRLISISKLSDGGSGGAKVWLLQYGAVCFIVIFICYNSIYWRRGMRRLEYWDWIFLLVFWLSFYQRQTIEMPYMAIVYFAIPLFQQYRYDTRVKLIRNRVS